MRSVRARFRKWPDSPHWEFDAHALGVDAHGHWLGVARGALIERPGRRFTAAHDHVVLVPHDGWWAATFYGTEADRPFDAYVDVTTPAVWEDGEVSVIDLDLDVVRSVDGEVILDDEDEFAEHRVSLGYPHDIVEGAETTAREVLAAMEAQEPPYDPVTAAAWLARFRRRLEETR